MPTYISTPSPPNSYNAEFLYTQFNEAQGPEEFYLQGYNAMWFVESQQTFWKNTATCFQAGFLLGLCFDPEDGGNMFIRNVG
jgi:hypothetical protein